MPEPLTLTDLYNTKLNYLTVQDTRQIYQLNLLLLQDKCDAKYLTHEPTEKFHAATFENSAGSISKHNTDLLYWNSENNCCSHQSLA